MLTKNFSRARTWQLHYIYISKLLKSVNFVLLICCSFFIKNLFVIRIISS